MPTIQIEASETVRYRQTIEVSEETLAALREAWGEGDEDRLASLVGELLDRGDVYDSDGIDGADVDIDFDVPPEDDAEDAP